MFLLCVGFEFNQSYPLNLSFYFYFVALLKWVFSMISSMYLDCHKWLASKEWRILKLQSRTNRNLQRKRNFKQQKHHSHCILQMNKDFKVNYFCILFISSSLIGPNNLASLLFRKPQYFYILQRILNLR